MSPDERKALAARLRAEADTLLDHGSTRDREQAADLLAAAAELERPRPVVEWFPDGTSGRWWACLRGGVRFRLVNADAVNEARADLLAAGFDVAPLPGVDDAP